MKTIILRFYFFIAFITLGCAFGFIMYINRTVTIEMDFTAIMLLCGVMVGFLCCSVYGVAISELARSEDEIRMMELQAQKDIDEAKHLSDALKSIALKKAGITRLEIDEEIERQKTLNKKS